MGETRLQRDARRHAIELRRAMGREIRRLREDAALTQAAVARAAGIDPSYVSLIEDGEREAGYAVLAAVGAVLGADLSVRLFATTGPRIHDRFQAAMEEAILRALSHDLWRFAAVDGAPATSRLLVLRSTRDLRELARTYEATLAAAYPARAADAVAALTSTAPWPGPAIVWMRVDGAAVRLLDGPPRGVRLGR
jgi:transcriptional regulator with XRE-family HTH domain